MGEGKLVGKALDARYGDLISGFINEDVSKKVCLW